MIKWLKYIGALLTLFQGDNLYSQDKGTDSANYYMNLTMESYKNGQVEKGLIFINRAFTFKSWPILHAYKAIGTFQLGKYKESIIECDSVVKTGGVTDLPFVLLFKANALEKLDQNDSALKYYIIYEKLKPVDPEVYYNKAKLFFKVGKYDLALVTCDNGLKLVPLKNDFYLIKADSYQRKGDGGNSLENYSLFLQKNSTEKDKAYYGMAQVYLHLENYSNALLSIRKAIEVDPARIEYYFTLWQLLSLSNEYKLLNSELQMPLVVKQFSASPTFNYFKAQVFFRYFNRNDSSSFFVKRAIQYSPSDKSNYFLYAEILLKQKRYLDAIAQYSNAIRKSNDSSFVYLCKCEQALCYTKLGEKKKGVDEIERLKKIKSNDKYLLFGLGRYYQYSENYKQALDYYMLSKETKWLKYQVNSDILVCLTELSDYENVLTQYSKLASEGRLNYNDLINYSQALISSNNIDQAIEILNKSLLDNQPNVSIYSLLALAYMKSNKLDACKKYIDIAAKMPDRDWLFYYVKGLVYLGLKNSLAFITTFQEGLQKEDHARKFYPPLTMFNFSQNDVGKAKLNLALFERKIVSKEDSETYYFNKSLLFVFAKEFSKCEMFMDSVIPLFSPEGKMAVKSLRIMIKAITGDLSSAQVLSTEIYEQTQINYYLKLKANLELIQGRFDVGIADYLSFLDQTPFTYNLITQFSEINKASPFLYIAEKTMPERKILLKLYVDTSKYTSLDLGFVSQYIDSFAAQVFYRTCLENVKRESEKYEGKVYYHLLLAHLMQKSSEPIEKILNEYDKAIAIDRNNPHIYILRGLYNLKVLKQMDSSCQDFRNAERLGSKLDFNINCP